MVDTAAIHLFSFVLMRMSGCVFLNPILNRRNAPAIFRVGMTLMLTLAVVNFTGASLPALSAADLAGSSLLRFFVLLLKEFLIGYVIGFTISLFSYAITFGGELADLQIGMSMSKIYDASSNVSLSLFATYYNVMYMLLFFIGGGHLTLVRIFLLSGDVVPYGQVIVRTEVSSALIGLFSECTILAVKFALPIIAVELLIEMGIGIIMKAVPQINIFVVNIQVKLLVGIAVVVLLFVPFSGFVDEVISRLFEAIRSAVALMG